MDARPLDLVINVLLIRRLIALLLKEIDEFTCGIAFGNVNAHFPSSFKYEFWGPPKSLERVCSNLAGMIEDISQRGKILSVFLVKHLIFYEKF